VKYTTKLRKSLNISLQLTLYTLYLIINRPRKLVYKALIWEYGPNERHFSIFK